MVRGAAILLSCVQDPAYLHYLADLLIVLPLTSLPPIRPLPQCGRH
jgi:hypothetical protein